MKCTLKYRCYATDCNYVVIFCNENKHNILVIIFHRRHSSARCTPRLRARRGKVRGPMKRPSVRRQSRGASVLYMYYIATVFAIFCSPIIIVNRQLRSKGSGNRMCSTYYFNTQIKFWNYNVLLSCTLFPVNHSD